MQIKFSRLTAILIFCLVTTMALPKTSKAQDSNVECKKAVANAKSRLRKTVNSTSILSIREDKLDYPDAPTNRNREIGFYFDYFKDSRPQLKVGIENILNSPQLMKSMSQDIISKCSSISAVYFAGTFNAGCPLYFGLMPNGTVKLFKFVSPGELNREIKWGENYCT